MDRQTKESVVASLNELFQSAQVGYLVDYCGLTVEAVNDLRRKLRAASAEMRVLKNNLAKIALKGTPFEELQGDITETRAFIYSHEPVGPAKVVTEFKSDKLSLIAGILISGGTAQKLDHATVRSLALLPSRDVLIAQILSVLQATQVKLVRTLNEVPGSFVRALAAVGEAKGEA